MDIDISVVIPTFRRPAQLAEALASVLGQTGATFEVFVVDDCPDRSAREVVTGVGDPRVTYVENPHPTGGVPSIVRNLAWPQARGMYLHFLDDDDRVPDGHYAAAKAAFADNPQVGLIFGRVEPFGSGPTTQLEHERAYFAAAARSAKRCGRFGARLAFAARMLFGPAMLVCGAGIARRTCVVRVGGFDPDIRLMEDADFFCRAMRTCGAAFVDRVALRYRIGTPSLMHAPNPPPEQVLAVREGVRRMRAKYRREHGWFEFFALAALARILSKYLSS